MRIRFHEDYYRWCCEWCDTENLILWAKLQEDVACGACHRKLFVEGAHGFSRNHFYVKLREGIPAKKSPALQEGKMEKPGKMSGCPLI